MSNPDVDISEDSTNNSECKSKDTPIDTVHSETEQTSLITEDSNNEEENNLNSSKSEKELQKDEADDDTYCKTRIHSRKRTSSNISDILNLGEENSNDEETSENHEILSNQKHLPVKRNSEKDKHRSGSKKRSRHFRKRKPYCKLTWQEQQQKVHERDTSKTQRIRDELTALGIALAPVNTNEFLIKDQMISSPDYDEIYENVPTISYIHKDFEEEYESLKEQYCTKLTKSELVQTWIEREDEIEAIEKELNVIKEQKRLRGITEIDIASGLEKIEVFRKEISNLMIENDKLYDQNERMKRLIHEHHF